MQKRQPDGTELVIARRAGIDNATAEVEVCGSIPVVKNVTVMKEPCGGYCDENGEAGRNNSRLPRKAIPRKP